MEARNLIDEVEPPDIPSSTTPRLGALDCSSQTQDPLDEEINACRIEPIAEKGSDRAADVVNEIVSAARSIGEAQALPPEDHGTSAVTAAENENSSDAPRNTPELAFLSLDSIPAVRNRSHSSPFKLQQRPPVDDPPVPEWDTVIHIDKRSLLEVQDPRHRYGKNLRTYYEAYKKLPVEARPPFFEWLDSSAPEASHLFICCNLCHKSLEI
jgi:hypothetical protein